MLNSSRPQVWHYVILLPHACQFLNEPTNRDRVILLGRRVHITQDGDVVKIVVLSVLLPLAEELDEKVEVQRVSIVWVNLRVLLETVVDERLISVERL